MICRTEMADVSFPVSCGLAKRNDRLERALHFKTIRLNRNGKYFLGDTSFQRIAVDERACGLRAVLTDVLQQPDFVQRWTI